jgi:hypothetical protein
MISTIHVLLIASIAAGVGLFCTSNPHLFGKRAASGEVEFDIYTHFPSLDDELFEMAAHIGKDFPAYRNHCLRVLSFTKYFLTDEVLKEFPNAMEIAGMALAYHHVALWSDDALNYLEPSVAQMKKHLGGTLNETEIAIVEDIIMNHHKITEFTSSDHGRSKAADALVNAVRKGDWTDATMGVIRFGLPSALIEAAYDALPGAGFHMLLVGFGKRLSPDSFIGQLEVLRIFKL